MVDFFVSLVIGLDSGEQLIRGRFCVGRSGRSLLAGGVPLPRRLSMIRATSRDTLGAKDSVVRIVGELQAVSSEENVLLCIGSNHEASWESAGGTPAGEVGCCSSTHKAPACCSSSSLTASGGIIP